MLLRIKNSINTDKDIISGIYENQDWAIRYVYRTEYISIKKMVYSFRNSILEPEDIFQEGLTRVIINIRAGKFKGESSLATYLNGICRNICLKLLSHSSNLQLKEDLISNELDSDNYYELLDLVCKIKAQLGNGCREIIDLRFKQSEEVPMTSDNNKLNNFEEIAHHLNISVDNARQRFKRCLDQLRNLIFVHPEYETLFD